MSYLRLVKTEIMARTNVCTPYVFEFESYITGHHVYKDIWTPILGEKLATAMEPQNPHDKYAIKVTKSDEVVGHIPRDISKYCTAALCCGIISCEVTGKRQNKRGNGLEVPCKYRLKGPYFVVKKIECIIEDYFKRIN